MNRQIIERGYLIPGWHWPKELGYLAHVAERENPYVHVEIGTYAGRSLWAFATHAGKCRILAVDPLVGPMDNAPSAQWSEDVLTATIAEIHQANPEAAVEFRRETSLECGRYCWEHGIVPDTVYLDGCHAKAEVKADIELWLKLLRPGGLLFGHDYWPVHVGVMDAVTDLLEPVHVEPETRIWNYRKPL